MTEPRLTSINTVKKNKCLGKNWFGLEKNLVGPLRCMLIKCTCIQKWYTLLKYIYPEGRRFNVEKKEIVIFMTDNSHFYKYITSIGTAYWLLISVSLAVGSTSQVEDNPLHRFEWNVVLFVVSYVLQIKWNFSQYILQSSISRLHKNAFIFKLFLLLFNFLCSNDSFIC